MRLRLMGVSVDDQDKASRFYVVDDVEEEVARLRQLGVTVTQEPLRMGPVITAVIDDTCCNQVQLAARVTTS